MNESLVQRLATLRQRITDACARVGRKTDEVRLLPVSKGFGPDAIQEAAAAGLTVFGESRVQEARAKIPACPGHLSWHFVGHLQRNKAREAVRLFDLLHAVDSLRLLQTLEDLCEQEGRNLPVFLEVNVGEDPSKFGLAPSEVPAVLEVAAGLRRVTVCGLMTVPPFTRDPADSRPYFRRLRECRDAGSVQVGMPLPELSMGMSRDFEWAIEEGATWVRIGTALFGPRPVRPAPGFVDTGKG